MSRNSSVSSRSWMMSASALYVLAESTIAASAAILLVALMRRPLRRLAGPGVACWLWLLVPASTLVVLLPVPPQTIQIASEFSVSAFAVTPSSTNAGIATNHAAALFVVWLSGCFVMMTFIAGRQRAFVRSLAN